MKNLLLGYILIICIVVGLFMMVIRINNDIEQNNQLWLSMAVTDVRPYKLNVRLNFNDESWYGFLYEKKLELYSNIQLLGMEYDNFEAVYYADEKKTIGEYVEKDDGAVTSVPKGRDEYGYISFTAIEGQNGYQENYFNCRGKIIYSILGIPFKEVFIHDNYLATTSRK